MLKKERLTFGNQLESLEFQLKKQDEEINKLKVGKNEKKPLKGTHYNLVDSKGKVGRGSLRAASYFVWPYTVREMGLHGSLNKRPVIVYEKYCQ